MVGCSGLSINFSLDSYCGTCTLTFLDKLKWQEVAELSEVTVTLNGQDYVFVVDTPDSNETFESTQYTITCRSKSCLLDFPYSPELANNDLVSGTSSAVVNALAGLKGQSVTWLVPADETLNDNKVSVTGSSPINAIRTIANEYGAVIQTSPAGVISVVPRHRINTDSYGSNTPVYIVDKGKDTVSFSTGEEKQYGYNKYFISTGSGTTGYKLEQEQIEGTRRHKIKAFKVPWAYRTVSLGTSELTGVVIQARGATEEQITEQVEIVKGSGTLKNPAYGMVSYSYGSRTNLGAVSFDEEGNLTTAVEGESLVDVVYVTRYYLWEVSNPDYEVVQFILTEL